MPKKTLQKKDIQLSSDRELKIFNVISNTTILLMMTFTETFSDIFAEMTKGMAQAMTTSVGADEANTSSINQNINTMKTELPQQVRGQLIAMKEDIMNQLQEKKEEMRTIIADQKFDKGITIAESYDFGIPSFTQNLNEDSLFKYISLLKANDPRFMKMFHDLMEWMNSCMPPNK